MKRILLALLPWMAMTSAAIAQNNPATVVFTHVGTVDEKCYRVGDECLVPFTFLDYVGWNYKTISGFADIQADGQKVRVPLRKLNDTPMVPLRMAVQKLGGEATWNENELDVLSPLKKVKIDNGHFDIEGAMAVQPKAMLLSDPARVVIDIQGAKLMRETKIELDGTSRIAQFRPDVVRIVLEQKADAQFAKSNFTAGTSFSFDISSVVSSPLVQQGPKVPLTAPQTAQFDPAANPDGLPTAARPAMSNTTAQIGPLTIDREDNKGAMLTLKISGKLSKAPTYRRPEPDVIEVVFAGAAGASTANFDLSGDTVTNTATRYENDNFIVRMRLSRPMGVEYSMNAGNMQIQLLKPNVGNGRLAGKTVVVDAGHGGHDSGTRSAGISEKNLTLAMAKKTSALLAAEGATVIMTRKTDVFIDLYERPNMGNRNGADFFVSIHINSNSRDNTASGTITFYHMRDPISQLMADCIQREITKRSGLGGMGVWSDSRIYPDDGFAVLRKAKMPAILLECGFLNTAKDRKLMLTEDFQNAVASGIVKGLKVFLGDEKSKD
jgi:N-acetylmuramoyl-L-alanine amidase